MLLERVVLIIWSPSNIDSVFISRRDVPTLMNAPDDHINLSEARCQSLSLGRISSGQTLSPIRSDESADDFRGLL